MKKLFRFLKPYRHILVTILLLTIMQTLGTLYIPTLTAEIIDKGIGRGDINLILKFGAMMLFVAVMTGAITIFSAKLSASVASKFSGNIREAVFKKAQIMSIQDMQKVGVASMITRATGDVNTIGQTTVMFFQMLLPAPFMAIAGLELAFTKNKTLALIILSTLIIFLIFTIVFAKKILPLYEKVQYKMDRITRILRENIIGVRVIRAFNREAYEKERIDETATDYANNSIRINRLYAFFQPGVMLIVNACIICIIWVGGSQSVKIGDIMAMIEYCFLILFSLIMAIMMFINIPKAAACADRINEVLELTPEINDPKMVVHADKTHGTVEFENVSFQYPNAEEPVLEGVNFLSKPGEITAIIGGTGSGKSTVVQLLMRFFDINKGAIKVNGTDIREMSQKELHDKIGYVPQKAFLFSGTIADNIRYGKPDATDEEVQHAAKIAQSHDFIMEKPDKYDSFVAQGGSNYSGGQKQRLCIARALARKPEVYVFDDSFSALDFKTDAVLRKALKAETVDSTVIIVAQRISTVLDANRILVLDDGRVVGIGTHKELMDSCTVYQQIAHSQLSEEELNEA